MAFRYLIYSTGTTFAETIVRESATNNPGAFEASLYSDFVIPEIQPLYLWRVVGGTTVLPNTDANINAYLAAIAPAPQPEDDASVGFVTGITSQKIDIVTGATGYLGTFTADGNLENSGYQISDLTGGTTYTFVGSGGTQVTEVGSTVTIYSALPSGTTVSWGDIVGTLSAQTDLQNALNAKVDISAYNSYTGATETRLQGIESDITYISGQTAGKLNLSVFNVYTGATQPIINAALTGVTNLGTGSTLGLVSGRNVILKSISAIGGVSLIGDINNLIISGETNVGAVWGNITGTLTNQTDLQNALNAKLNITTFNSFTGTTLPANYYNKTEINAYTGATDTRIDNIEAVTNIALTGATNGLTKTGKNAELGGILIKNTVISGTTFDFGVNTKSITLQAINGISIIDTDGVGGINLESDAGTISLVGKTNLSAERTKLEISETQMLITDSRTTKVGLQYAADYSTSFTDESLITKRYADAIASGLIPKASVLVATTANITLSGLQTVDGVALANGDRVLVKDQSTAADNGIYVANASTWTRATDYDGTPDGEVSSGNIIPIISGTTLYSTLWVLITPNPITVGITDLDFTLFSSPHEMIAGTGISILGNTISVNGSALAGNSIAWTGNTFNVDISTGTLATALGSKLNVSDFNYYSGTTVPATYLSINNFNGFTGTTLPANYYNKIQINAYTGATDTRLQGIETNITYISGVTDTKLPIAVFSAYTGTTAPNEIFLTHTGGTELNTILATAIEWDNAVVSGAAFSWTGSSEIQVLETGLYEVSYNIPYNITSNSSIGVGANLILNNATVIDVTAAAGLATRSSGAGSIGLPTVVLSLTANDVLNLATFRTMQSGTATSSLTGSILIKKKNTLQ